ncbi:hypothetical protein ACJIZ3_021737 [Penstemon smallii]|uniref:Aluminum-activated malate transporter 8-like n=1 Tax=Penstemon smallii TaxID=265156 RepID=A0ABD3SMZ3_9LAMI
MEMNTPHQEKKLQFVEYTRERFKAMFGWIKIMVADTAKKFKKIGKDDPRRIVHSMKVGLALTLVSLFYYFRPLYDGFGQAGMWAVLTVVVVFEFTVGGTLSKSINRGCATLVAGALGVGAEYLAGLCGEKGEPIVLGILVFILASTSTFMRFFPHVKRRYDYGVLIFILTFSLVAVSGFRVTQILQLAHQRLSTILIGGATCMIISIFVWPVWAGQDLHNLIATNIENLGSFLEGFGGEFFNFPGSGNCTVSSKDDDVSFLKSYKSVLNSKATEESLANFAWWEPAHGRFRFHHPWKQYLKISVLARECACQIETLNSLINSKPKVALEFHAKIQQPCTKLSTESGKALKELATAIKNMTYPSSAVQSHIENSKAAADDIKSILENSSLPTKADLQEIMPVLVTASVLIDNIKCIEKISVSVLELSQMARFLEPKSTDGLEKQQQLLHRGIVKPVDDVIVKDDDRVVIEITPKDSIAREKAGVNIKF